MRMSIPPSMGRTTGLISCLLLQLCCSKSSCMAQAGGDNAATAQAGQPVTVAPSDNGSTDINKAFRDPQMDVSEWVERFEAESREIFASRESILEALPLQPGTRVVDVGAGTGFMSRRMAAKVGASGWVYAVDIAPAFLQYILERNRLEHITNVTTVLGADDSVGLPPNSVDVVFVCDTYHHFEYPEKTLASIHRALTAGGHLIVIDFEREPGTSREWVIQHVRAGKREFSEEISRAGFRLEREVPIEGFHENYFLQFVKVQP